VAYFIAEYFEYSWHDVVTRPARGRPHSLVPGPELNSVVLNPRRSVSRQTYSSIPFEMDELVHGQEREKSSQFSRVKFFARDEKVGKLAEIKGVHAHDVPLGFLGVPRLPGWINLGEKS